MLQEEIIRRDGDGFWTHSVLDELPENIPVDIWMAAKGCSTVYRQLDTDRADYLVDVKQWNPIPPPGAGWIFIGIWDTEDGAMAAFSRDENVH